MLCCLPAELPQLAHLGTVHPPALVSVEQEVQFQCVPDQTAPPQLKLEAAANTPGLTQLGREKGIMLFRPGQN